MSDILAGIDPIQAAKLILICYAWIVVVILILFLGRIAYFYAKTSKRRVRYHFLAIPLLLLLAGTICYVAVQWRQLDFIGLPIGDFLLFLGGLALFSFGSRLQRLMTGE